MRLDYRSSWRKYDDALICGFIFHVITAKEYKRQQERKQDTQKLSVLNGILSEKMENL